ncbi:hypothetical protein [Marininema halotolerans]|uniref:Uncharacterized protein n=1 Tax=Marininema halotolerans TaxID=1155944 RepID=A0A1I6SMP8_9BACL|nr:hypothetical protein [Marininema halotolerans]SFS78048.1 hypothetical protein SAMN05444972_107196 [Marininema halotolerans]
MATLQQTTQVSWRGSQPLLQKALRGSGFAMLNLVVLVIPTLLAINGFSLAQNWIFSEKDAIYFHSYSDTTFSMISLLLILALMFFCIRALQNGSRQIQQSIRLFRILVIVSLPLLLFTFDSYLMIGPDHIVQSPINNVGHEISHNWNDVESISVSHTFDAEDELFTGQYILHFADMTDLEIWQAGGMSLTHLQQVNHLASTHHIPIFSSTPLSPVEMSFLQQSSITPSEVSFLKQLFYQ